MSRAGPRGSVAGMKFEKSPPWLVELFGDALAGTAGERSQMFGYPCRWLSRAAT